MQIYENRDLYCPQNANLYFRPFQSIIRTKKSFDVSIQVYPRYLTRIKSEKLGSIITHLLFLTRMKSIWIHEQMAFHSSLYTLYAYFLRPLDRFSVPADMFGLLKLLHPLLYILHSLKSLYSLKRRNGTNSIQIHCLKYKSFDKKTLYVSKL